MVVGTANGHTMTDYAKAAADVATLSKYLNTGAEITGKIGRAGFVWVWA